MATSLSIADAEQIIIANREAGENLLLRRLMENPKIRERALRVLEGGNLRSEATGKVPNSG